MSRTGTQTGGAAIRTSSDNVYVLLSSRMCNVLQKQMYNFDDFNLKKWIYLSTAISIVL